ncbi:MAG: cyclopropane fatty acyl phospholipid synthase [Acidimicrobiia bacterium]|nr:cyclopropane fatty acyl phospholipid synthase [Acidimicrobiia bacterium]
MGDAKRLGHDLLERAGITVGGDEPHDIEIHDERLFERVVRDRELGLGEAYQDGWWDANELDAFMARIVESDIRSAIRPSPKLLWLTAGAALSNRQNIRRARSNASAHYDIGNDLYERMLDPRMIYSCAYWANADDLATAQEAKLELICRKLHLEPGMRLLDIGCGWGGFAHYAAEKFGADVVGISPAAEQVRVAKERCADVSARIEQLDYRDVGGRFDRIVSIGMMEHVGPKNYRGFFRRCDELLESDGVMLHHTIGSNESKNRSDPWFDKYIFPGGVLPSIGQIGAGSEKRWCIEDLQNLGPDYDPTLRAWHSNIDARWDEIPRYDERFRRTWRYYLLSSAASFRVRSIQLWQLVFRRTNTRSDTYVGLR